MPEITDPNVLVGTSSADDAGVYKINEELALIQTVDFFTPIVDDPKTYGMIAAANALSDIYAMGARPVSALAIGAFPEDLDPAIVSDILAGGVAKASEAGIAIIGGHTIKDDEPKYGLAVTGLAHPQKIWRNNTAQPGDALILTKPIGTGILTTAKRSDEIGHDDLQPAVESMLLLNKTAAEIASGFEIHASTDITGFGFIGHLSEMTSACVGAAISLQSIPVFRCALSLAERDIVPGGTRTNHRLALSAGVDFNDITPAQQLLLCDAQTSGGLLLALRPSESHALLEALRTANLSAAIVGEITSDSRIRVSP